MKRMRRLLVILLLGASMVWIYYNVNRRKSPVMKNIIDDQGLENTLEKQVLEIMSNDIEESETYPLDLRETPASISEKYEKELHEAGVDVRECLKELKEMLKGNELTGNVHFEDDFLKLYLRSCKYKINKAFSKIQNFVNLKDKHSYFFKNIDFDFTQNPAYRFLTIFPLRRKDGSVTVLCELAKWDPEEVPFVHMKQMLFMIFVQQLRNPVTQASGFNVIYDFENAGFKYLKYGSRENLQLLNHVALDTLPVKFIGIHIINVNIIARMLVTVMRPFLPQYITDIFYVHAAVEELLEFYPHSMLPTQYGGNLTNYYYGDWLKKANEKHNNFPPGGQKNEL